jgi:hypothetical protein
MKTKMKERPILFNGEMVRAIVEWKKTQTRRIIKPQPSLYKGGCHPKNKPKHSAPYFDCYCGDKKTPENPRGMGQNWCWWTEDDRQGIDWIKCPYGVPGDRLWVRETWGIGTRLCPSMGCIDGIEYRADQGFIDDIEILPLNPCIPDYVQAENYKEGWKPSIHMSRWASRITLEITDIRVERLQDISEEGAKAEGVEWYPALKPIRLFQDLWEDINGKESWDLNPWVWVLEFKRL